MILDRDEPEFISGQELDDACELVHQKNYPGSAPLPRDTKPGPDVAKFYTNRAKPATSQPPDEKNRDGRIAKIADEVIIARRNAGSVELKSIPYLWHGVIPTHMATAITGESGMGKTLVCADMAARISKGVAFPIYDKPGAIAQGRVFYVTSEGVPEMILAPRLYAAGADLSKVDIIEGIYTKTGEFGILDICQHLPQLEKDARSCPDLKLIIVDPIASFLPEKLNTGQQNQVRRAMDLLSNLAQRLGVAVVIVMHFAKAQDGKAINRTSGSAQFMAAMKMGLSVVKRTDDLRNVRLLVPQKSNISGSYKSLSFTIQPATFTAANKELIETAKIEYTTLVDEDPNTLICPPQENTDLALAVGYLKRKMEGVSVVLAQDVIAAGKEEGIAAWSIKKARVKLGLVADKEDKYQGRWLWHKP